MHSNIYFIGLHPKEIDYLGDIRVDGRIILKWIINRYDVK
jgi:hypothetical protein